MAMDPVTGEIKAWVGGVNFKTFKYDHVNIKTQRQVGLIHKTIFICTGDGRNVALILKHL